MKRKWKELIINLGVIAMVLSVTLPFVDYGTNELETDEFVLERENTSFILTREDFFSNLTVSKNLWSGEEVIENICNGNDSISIFLLFEDFPHCLEGYHITYDVYNPGNYSITSLLMVWCIFDDEPLDADVHSFIYRGCCASFGSHWLVEAHAIVVHLQVMIE